MNGAFSTALKARGSGPTLRINCGDGDVAIYGPPAHLLADRHTVITRDPWRLARRDNRRGRLAGAAGRAGP